MSNTTRTRMSAAESKAKLVEDCKNVENSAFDFGVSRETMLGSIQTALRSTKPNKTIEDAVRLSYIAARMAAAVPSNLPKDERIESMRLKLTSYASADSASVKSGQLGKRSEIEEKAYKAAREWWSKAKADCGVGKAKTTRDKNKGREPKAGNSGKAGQPSNAPVSIKQASEALAAVKVTDNETVVIFYRNVANMLEGFQKKNAKEVDNKRCAIAVKFIADIRALDGKPA